MSVVVIGLEQHKTPLDLLERATIPEDGLAKTLARLRDRPNFSEVAVLSTCLRTEIYAVVERFHEGVADLQEFLASYAGTPIDSLAEYMTVLFDDGVALHLFEVASGLRSAVLGETEVLGQVRRAIERAEAEKAAGPVLSGLFRRAVQTGRKARSSTGIARGTTSLSHVAVDVAAARLGGSLDDRRVLVIGAGEMGEGVVEGLAKRHEHADVVVANRTAGRARTLAEKVDGEGIGLAGLADALVMADAVIVSTGATLHLLDAELLERVAAERAEAGRAQLVIVDLGVPRNVDPAVAGIAGLELLDMDDLGAHAERALEERRAEAVAVEAIVRQEVERFRAEDRARGAAPVVAALRGRLDEVRVAELERHRSRLVGLDEDQWHEVDAVVRDVLAKVMHQPTVALKDAAGTARGERLVEAVRALFDL
ncbi:MAG TPA: glutamyl-tRNA reductase [Acidimicrobiales bacterium]|nr:glutamyl-tRNA reductase [Acidimicrobiales bacterium]